MERAYDELAGRCRAVCVAGLSMGGTLALWLAARWPEVLGLVLVNPLSDGTAPGITQTVTDLRDPAEQRAVGFVRRVRGASPGGAAADG